MHYAQFYLFDSERGKELRSICRILLKHFRDLDTNIVKACELGMRSRGSSLLSPLETHPMGDYKTAGDALKLLLDGNQRGERGLAPLGVTRFWWYQAETIMWNWDTSGRKRDWTNSFAGYVEGGRPALEDRRGK
ncbi:MAG: hypothetical protein CL912_28485 [Deltaproteobacteria bacterium]|nr:hypothetical protein [Deltaproteobacteria bacterium]